MLRAPATLLLCLISSVQAEELRGRVTSVVDGDTITLLDGSNRQHRLRIAGIDAPERGQPFADRSRQRLSELARRKVAIAECNKVDRYRRVVCKVWVEPADCPRCGLTLDLGMSQIVAGLAWWDRAFAAEQSDEDRGRYESSEQEARARKRGLWSENNAVAPWEWRTATRGR